MNYVVYNAASSFETLMEECVYPSKERAEEAVLRLLADGTDPDDIRIFAEVKANIEITIEF